MYRIIFAFFFLSGFSSLVFEVLWERMLMRVFGTTSFAISTLLTAFMAGLALGSYVGGRYAARIKSPLRVYALLEAGVGLYALVVPAMLGLLSMFYEVVFAHFMDSFYLFSLLRFAAVFAVLVIPTTLMGATLPIVSQWVARRERAFQGSVGLLYGMNTLGACMGCLLAGFLLLPALGQTATNGVFAAVNVLLGVLVYVTAPWLERQGVVYQAENAESEDVDEALGRWVPVAPLSRAAERVLLGAFALTGVVAMSYQVLWTRAYVIILGSSTYSFTIILTAVLIGIALGSSLISRFVTRIGRPVFWLALTQTGVAASASWSFFVLDKLPEWLFWRMRDTIGSAMEVYLFNFLLVALVVLLPSALQGMSFALVIRALTGEQDRKDEAVGRRVGMAYAWNTSGSIIGSFGAGFVLMPVLGLQSAIGLVIAVNLSVALVLAVLSIRAVRHEGADETDGEQAPSPAPPRREAIWLTLALATTVTLVIAAPPLDRVRLTAGMFRTYWARELFTPEKFERDRPELLFYADGLTATTSVEKRGKLVTLKANGKPEASDGADMATQVLVGLMPFVVRSGHTGVATGGEEAVMVGYGSGVTAGGSLQWPLKSLEVIEIEGTMMPASRFFDHVNHRPMEDPRTRVIESDGRNYLEYTPQTYDVIVSEPSNPWIAGVSSLFTEEHFTRVRDKLRPNGVFAQWVQLYEMRPVNVQRIFATILKVFPHVQAFSSMPKGTDLILIASNEPLPMPVDGYQRAWAIPSVQKELERVGIRHIEDLYGLSFMTQGEMEAFAKGATTNTDDNGILEFEAPKDLIFYRVGQQFFAEQYFRKGTYGDVRPYLGPGAQKTWTDVQHAALARAQWLGGKPELARKVLEEAGLGSVDAVEATRKAPIAEPWDALEDIHLVLHAASLPLGESLLQAWPVAQSTYASLIVEAVAREQVTNVIAAIESKQRPETDGYSGELGLLYAWLLSQGKYYKHAERQLDRLAREADHQIVESLPYLLTNGFVRQKRLQLHASYDAYLAAGRQLAVQEPAQEPAQEPEPAPANP